MTLCIIILLEATRLVCEMMTEQKHTRHIFNVGFICLFVISISFYRITHFSRIFYK